MSVLAIVHPSKHLHPLWLDVKKRLEQWTRIDEHCSQWAGHSTELARELSPQEGVVVVVGGDGTFHEVINGWMSRSQRGRPGFLLVPLGTGNDFARDQKLSRDACRIAEAARNPRLKSLDLGHLQYQGSSGEESRYFLNAATLGFSAETTRFAQTLPRFFPGTVQYLFSLLVSLMRWENRSARLDVDQQSFVMPNLFNLNIANTRFYGGGMVASPRAHPQSGTLEAVVMELNRWGVLKALPRNYNGKFDGVEGVRQVTVRDRLRVPDQGIPVQADGEFLGETPVKASVVRNAFSILVTG